MNLWFFSGQYAKESNHVRDPHPEKVGPSVGPVLGNLAHPCSASPELATAQPPLVKPAARDEGGEGRRTKCRSPSNPPSSSLLPLFTPTSPPLLLHHRSRCRPPRRLPRLGADARGGIDRSNQSARGGLLGYWWCSYLGPACDPPAVVAMGQGVVEIHPRELQFTCKHARFPTSPAPVLDSKSVILIRVGRRGNRVSAVTRSCVTPPAVVDSVFQCFLVLRNLELVRLILVVYRLFLSFGLIGA
jgi:hypothetical protein